ncbi:MAG: undecaprenyldiphospho-muramoylpentapeptide beta-N-acetylglucosaminyltransferase [Spirochaetia bacterium]|nr:undecaprenyldiphospho-muramoylpentapeptide beta-N-acetylglucosaminyltransferase [Spirochaetia bacterium]MCF7940385.1 undecaprenyldiphospho-muramoylpentapeptide beta-N-acetylglucosaminyltransferase [Spirochaetia bacterium]
MRRRIVCTGGGTGGHVYPGIEVLEALKEQYGTSLEYCWLGDRMGPEALITGQEGIPFHAIRSGKLRRYLSMRNLTDLFRVAAGVVDSYRFLRRYRPDVLFSKGGFVSVPPVIAASLLGIPVVTHESDMDPGLANRIIGRFAKSFCAAYEQTVLGYRGPAQVHVTGNPVRRALLDGDGAAGRALFSLDESTPVVLVLGGSQGALEINEVIWQWAQEGISSCSIVHQAGEKTFRDLQAEGYHTVRYLSGELADLLAAADLVISRAGAGALSEIAASGTPMILIPKGRSSSRGDQIRNAQLFASHGAAIVLKDEEVTLENLKNAVSLVLEDPETAKGLSVSASLLTHPDAAGRIASVITPYLERGSL